jgi:hypothetical protein
MSVGTTIVVPFWLAVSQKSDYLRILQPVSLKASVVNPEPMSILPHNFAPNTAFAWIVNFANGRVQSDGAKTNLFFVWCVHGGQGVDPQ